MIASDLEALAAVRRVSEVQALALAQVTDVDALCRAAAMRRDAAHGATVSYSRKVFVPLTRLCRDSCHYCTFARAPRQVQAAYLTVDEVLAIARAGAAAGCKEALFTLGDKPELRYEAARDVLRALGHATTVDYLVHVARIVIDETGLLPHVNPGVLTHEDLGRLRAVSVSQGMMLESAAQRLCGRGGPHFGSPDKHPVVRLESIARAGEAAVPFTSGILIGIGETRRERIESLLALLALHERYGHLQELIIQNFRPKPGTRMALAPAPTLDELRWTIAVARLVFEPAMNIQAPPNLSPGALHALIGAGINDWGGVSPVTPDHVNPEAPWPHLAVLAEQTRAAGKELVERLALYPSYVRGASRWVDAGLRTRVLHACDATGFARTDAWAPGTHRELPADDLARIHASVHATAAGIDPILARALQGRRLDPREIVRLFAARGAEFTAVCTAADRLRSCAVGDRISYVINRNINYTNICGYRCQFCAFAKGKASENLRGQPYVLAIDDIVRRAREAWDRGATEVCMQGGIHPSYTGRTYLDICNAVKAAVPAMHIHAFSPLEITQGARTLGMPVRAFLDELKDAGLSTLPGTAAEILDDDVRAVLCPDKLRTAEWVDVMRHAHAAGLRTTATIMFGHVDAPEHWARHLLTVRDLQEETGGFTEFVPLPFVHMEAPLFRKGRARMGPTFRETVLMHAIARLALHPVIANIQTSWVKLGHEGVKHCLRAGANDLGGTLMDESISRAAGALHGREMDVTTMQALIRGLGREPWQRTTLYADAPARHAGHAAPASAPLPDQVPHTVIHVPAI